MAAIRQDWGRNRNKTDIYIMIGQYATYVIIGRHITICVLIGLQYDVSQNLEQSQHTCCCFVTHNLASQSERRWHFVDQSMMSYGTHTGINIYHLERRCEWRDFRLSRLGRSKSVSKYQMSTFNLPLSTSFKRFATFPSRIRYTNV